MSAFLNRRGVVYTVITIFILLIVATIFFTQQRVGQRDKHDAERSRLLSINDFIRSMETDSERAAYIAGFRTLIAMEQQVTSTGQYIQNPDDVFLEIFLMGSLDGDEFQVMENSSFMQYVERVELQALKQGIEFNATVVNISIWQAEPWTLLVNTTLEMNVTDLRGTARWETSRVFVGTIPIEDIRDPLFTKETLGRVQRVVMRTNVTTFVNDVGDMNDTTGLMTHFNNSWYRAQGRGPTLLMRFAGNLSDHPYGIESLVDVEEIDAQGLQIYNSRTVVDYEYFSGTGADACDIQNVPEHVKFETQSLATYEVEGNLDYSAC